MHAFLSQVDLLAEEQFHAPPALEALPARRRRSLLTHDQRDGLFVMLVGVAFIAAAALLL